VLDVGCGAGRHCNFFNSIGAFSVGLDVSEKMVSLARKNGIYALVGDGFHIPFKEESFDAVLLTNNIVGNYPLQEGRKLVREAIRVAKNYVFVELKLGTGREVVFEKAGYKGLSRYWSREDMMEFLNKFKLKFKEEGAFRETIGSRVRVYTLFTIFKKG